MIVTHNLQQAYRIADHVAFMYLGELVEYGPAEQRLRRAARAAHPGVRQWRVRLRPRPELAVLAGLARRRRAAGRLRHDAGASNARAKLSAERQIARARAAAPRRAQPAGRVAGATLVRGAAATGPRVVVELRSRARTPLTDVPIAVGVRTRGGKPLALNGGRDLDWFETHVPRGPPARRRRGSSRPRRRRAGAGRAAYAQVGRAARQARQPAPSSLPRLQAGDLGRRARARRSQRLRRPAVRPAGLRRRARRRPLRRRRPARSITSAERRQRGHGRRAARRRAAARAQTQVHVLPTIFE